MSDMIRKQIYITRRHNNLLKRLAKSRGVSEAEIIRQAIERETNGLSITNRPDSHKAMEESIQFALSLRNRTFEGEPYRWNRADAYEERENRLMHDRKP
jgi:hypothetical protein